MKQSNRIVKALLLIAIPALVCMNAYSYIKNNGAGGGYGGGDSSSQADGSYSQYNDIEYYIMLGGGYFLDADAHVQKILKAVEWQDIQGVNYYEMQFRVENALFHMKNAEYIYELIINTAEITPYNRDVQALLKEFNYEAFMLENNLNIELFNIVRKYLQAGDITGVFKYTYNNYTGIIELLETIKKDVYCQKMPGLTVFRQINETLNHTSTFGSYVARVFAALNPH